MSCIAGGGDVVVVVVIGIVGFVIVIDAAVAIIKATTLRRRVDGPALIAKTIFIITVLGKSKDKPKPVGFIRHIAIILGVPKGTPGTGYVGPSEFPPDPFIQTGGHCGALKIFDCARRYGI